MSRYLHAHWWTSLGRTSDSKWDRLFNVNNYVQNSMFQQKYLCIVLFSHMLWGVRSRSELHDFSEKVWMKPPPKKIHQMPILFVGLLQPHDDADADDNNKSISKINTWTDFRWNDQFSKISENGNFADTIIHTKSSIWLSINVLLLDQKYVIVDLGEKAMVKLLKDLGF